jgi:hypothetical protein
MLKHPGSTNQLPASPSNMPDQHRKEVDNASIRGVTNGRDHAYC